MVTFALVLVPMTSFGDQETAQTSTHRTQANVSTMSCSPTFVGTDDAVIAADASASLIPGITNLELSRASKLQML